MNVENETTLRVSKSNQERIASILLKNESYNDGILLLLWLWMNPKRKATVEPHIRQTIIPQLSKEECKYVEKMITRRGE